MGEREKKATAAAAKEAAATVREAEAEAGMAALEALAAGLLVVEGEGDSSRVKSASKATEHPRWERLWARISPARKAAATRTRTIEEGLRQLRQRARDEPGSSTHRGAG